MDRGVLTSLRRTAPPCRCSSSTAVLHTLRWKVKSCKNIDRKNNTENINARLEA